MRIRQLLKEDDAVSPVIGVILMVAITVILAAVIASFVLGLGDQANDVAPNADFEIEFDSSASSNQLSITHDTGDDLTAKEIFIVGDAMNQGSSASDSDSLDISWDQASPKKAESKIKAGNSAQVYATSAYDVEIIWRSADTEDSATLGSQTGPDA